MEADKKTDPVAIGFFRFPAVMQRSNGIANLVQQADLGHGMFPP